MVQKFIEIVNEIEQQLKADMNDNYKWFLLALNAHNYMSEQERDGADYIFDINDKKDLQYLVGRDILNAQEIADIVAKKPDHLFTINDKGVNVITEKKAKDIIAFYLNFTIKCAFMYVDRCNNNSPYAELYGRYVADALIIDDKFNQL